MIHKFLNKNVSKIFIYLLKTKVYFFKGIKKNDLLIFDDIFPNPISGFRHEEYSQLLLHFNKSKIISTGAAYRIVNSPETQFKEDIENFKIKFPDLKNKLFQKSRFININTKLFYCIFINNIYKNLIWLEKHKIPFVFTLYPGGGFQVDDETSNFKLKKVLESPQFRKVIVTQQFTLEYLIKNKFCTLNKINFIFGGVVPQVSLKKDLSIKLSYLINKPTLDICFCAAKYMPKGIDKGYDIFIELAHMLNIKFDFVRFHVIGGFDQNDIDVSNLNNNIKFYGYQNFDNLNQIFKNMDIIVSPNKPFYLDKGAFDGFPLGTVVEAVLNGVAALLSDQLNQNNVFENYKEIVIIENYANKIEIEILNLINNPEKLYNLSEKGRLKFVEVYSNQVQMKPRIELLENEIINSK